MISFGPYIKRNLARITLFFLITTAFGCGYLKQQAVRYHTFYYPIPIKQGKGPEAGVIMIYRFLMIPSEETYGLVVSGLEEGKDYSEYEKWKEKPADMITDLIRRDLVASGIFHKAVGQTSNIRYRYALEGQIHKLKADVTEKGPMARIEMDITLIDFEAPAGRDRNILKKKYTVKKKCQDTSAESVVDGLNDAVKEFSTKLRKDIKKALDNDHNGKDDGKIPPQSTRKARMNPGDMSLVHCNAAI